MEFEEPSPRPAPTGSGLAPAWWIALPLIAIGLWVWIDRRGEPEPVAETPQIVQPHPAPTESGDAAQVIHLREMLRRAERELAN